MEENDASARQNTPGREGFQEFLLIAVFLAAAGVTFVMWASELTAVIGIGPESGAVRWGLAYPDKVAAANAGKHIDEFKQVCGTVAEEVFEPSFVDDLVFLNFDEKQPNQSFTAWGGSSSVVGHVNTQGLEKDLQGEFVCVQGRIASFQGRPQIKIEHFDQLRKDTAFLSLMTLAVVAAGVVGAMSIVYPEVGKPRSTA